MAGMAPPHGNVHACLPFLDAVAHQVEKKGFQLSVQDVTFLLNQTLPRRTFTEGEALKYVKEKLKRNKASTCSHLKRYKQEHRK